MSIYITIGLLIFSGIGLILIEVIFVPGTTIVGIIGFLLAGLGIYVAFGQSHTEGWITLGTSAILCLILLVIGLRGGTWKRFAIQDQQIGNKSVPNHDFLKVGDQGKTISTLRPMGNALFNDQVVEVSSMQGLIEEGNPIIIVALQQDKVTVTTISKDQES